MDIINPETIQNALDGAQPPLGHPLTASELGERLAAHRQGRYPGRPYTRAAISLYKTHPDQQTPDFVAAFRSWTAAETLRQDKLRVRYNGMTADEMLGEQGYIQQLGDDPVKALIAVGQLPPHTLISVNGHAATVECLAPTAVCTCGRQFIKRSWNHTRCAACQALPRRQEPVKKERSDHAKA